MSSLPPELVSDVAAVQRLRSVPQLLELACQVTKMQFAVVARVTDDSWTACAVLDKMGLGLLPGGQLPLETTLCTEVRLAMQPVAFDHASTDPVFKTHHTPRIYGLESYISVPIVLPNGTYFGNLCAVGRTPAAVANEQTLTMFKFWADLIGAHLEEDASRGRERQLALDERAAGELREQFIAVLGHDLRNPLTAVSVNATLLKRKVDPALVPAVERIQSSAQRMAELIDDVLDFARGRLGAGLGMAKEEVHDLDAALSDVIAELRTSHPDRSVSASVVIDRPVRCDRRRIQQLLSNLLGNAMAHGRAGSPVEVVARIDAQELILSVRNEGEPIPADDICQVFSPFWRKVTSASTSKAAGLGLGLYICNRIVSEHDGRLDVASSAEDGTVFTAHIPLHFPLHSPLHPPV